MRHLGAEKEGLVGFAIIGGAVIAVLGLVATFMVFSGGAFRATLTRDPNTGAVSDIGSASLLPLTLLVAGAGLALVVGGLGYGLWTNKRSAHGPIRRIEDVKVIARYAFARDGSMVPDYLLDDDDTARTYVKLDLGNGTAQEYECSREVFYSAGEGMRGNAQVQGKWLGLFEGIVGENVH